MNHTIDNLVRQFERGSLTRRQLVQALLMVAASPALAQERPAGAFHPTGIDHVQITVTDLKATQQFYEKLFGVTTTSPNPTQLSLRLGSAGDRDARIFNSSMSLFLEVLFLMKVDHCVSRDWVHSDTQKQDIRTHPRLLAARQNQETRTSISKMRKTS